MALRDYLVGEVAEDHADGLLTRREALRRLGLFGLSLPAAAALLSACGGSDDDDAAIGSSTTAATAAPTSDASGAQGSQTITFDGLTAAYAARAGTPAASVLVIHENRGLTPHFHDLVGRFAGEGFAALCVDLVSAEGGTASMDEGAAQAALGAAPLERLLGDLGRGIDELERRAPDAAVVVVGFCFGGGMTWNLLDAGDQRIDVAIPFYGPAPADADFSGSRAAVLGIYAGLDDRVNASRDAAAAALEAAGLEHEIRTFDGVGHAFFNDTGQRYDVSAAEEAWQLVLDWIADHTSA